MIARQPAGGEGMNDLRITDRCRWMLLGALLATVGAAGCAQYQSQPLTAEAVERRLATPDAQTVRMATGALRHPILQPIEIDLNKELSPDQVAVLAVIVNPDLRAERDRRAVA